MVPFNGHPPKANSRDGNSSESTLSAESLFSGNSELLSLIGASFHPSSSDVWLFFLLLSPPPFLLPDARKVSKSMADVISLEDSGDEALANEDDSLGALSSGDDVLLAESVGEEAMDVICCRRDDSMVPGDESD